MPLLENVAQFHGTVWLAPIHRWSFHVLVGRLFVARKPQHFIIYRRALPQLVGSAPAAAREKAGFAMYR